MAKPTRKTIVPAPVTLDDAAMREFTWWIARGHPEAEAAKRAGLPATANTDRFMRSREYGEMLRDVINGQLSNELAPKAIGVLEEILDDRSVQARVRVDAAKAILDRSGYSATPPVDRQKSAMQHLTDMTLDELRKFVADGQRQMRGEFIDVTPEQTVPS